MAAEPGCSGTGVATRGGAAAGTPAVGADGTSDTTPGWVDCGGGWPVPPPGAVACAPRGAEFLSEGADRVVGSGVVGLAAGGPAAPRSVLWDRRLGGVTSAGSGRDGPVGATGTVGPVDNGVDAVVDGAMRPVDGAGVDGDCPVDWLAGGPAGATGETDSGVRRPVSGALRTIVGEIAIVGGKLGGRASAVGVLVVREGLIAVCTQVGSTRPTSAIAASTAATRITPRPGTHLVPATMPGAILKGAGGVRTDGARVVCPAVSGRGSARVDRTGVPPTDRGWARTRPLTRR
jgi:hypothetical protein